MSSNLNLKKFNMNLISQDKVVLFIGKRNTGKSFLVKDLLYHNKDIPVGTVISGTESANEFYTKIVPPIFIHDDYNDDIVGNLLRRQKKTKKKLNLEIKTNSYSNIKPHAFLILDDLMDSAKQWVKSQYIKYCFMNGRHVHLLFILTMQFALGIPPELRANVDYIFILRENIVSNRKRLYDHYAGMFPTFDIFQQVMDNCTEDYQCIVIDNCSQSNKIEDQVFWYKAESHEPFKIGSSQLWNYNNKLYNNKYDSDSDKQCLEQKSKKNSCRLNVKKMK
jgi:hypothetical protein